MGVDKDFDKIEVWAMDLLSYRTSRKLSQEQAARELGIKSAGHLSEIERHKTPAGSALALRIETWSGGAVPADSLSPTVAQIRQGEEGAAA